MEQNTLSDLEEVDLRQDHATPETTRPQSTSKFHSIFNSAIRKTFRPKKRRHTAPVSESDLLKNSISGPCNVSQVIVPEDNFEFSRNSIQKCPFDISGYGLFLLMDEFKVQRPRKMALMVFLFEKIIIFTQKQQDADAFYYIDSLKLDQIGLLAPSKNKKLLVLKDYLSTSRFHKESIFSLEAPSEYIQTHWRKTIEKCLWTQLIKAKNDGGLGKT